ncbi:MAG: ABC transporter substrate-binding protein [Candidatus Methylacidiphilales bacterium]
MNPAPYLPVKRAAGHAGAFVLSFARLLQRRARCGAASALALTLAVASCATVGDAAAQQPEREKVTVIKLASPSSYVDGKLRLTGVNYALEKEGWLKEELAKHGVTYEWYPIGAATGPQINEAFASKQIQFGSYGDLPAIILNSNAGNITRLVVPTSYEDAFLVVPKDSTVASIEELKGKRLSIHKGRPWELSLLRLLDSKKLSYNDFRIFNIEPGPGASALATGGIDALFTLQAYNLEEKGLGKIIWSTKGQPPDWKVGIGVWGARDFLEKQPELAQIVVTAYVRAAHWVSRDENREEMVKIGTVTGVPESVVRRNYEDPTISWRNRWSPLFAQHVYDHYRVNVDYALDKKIIRKRVGVEDLIEPRFLTQALKDLKLEEYWSREAAPGSSAGASVTPKSETPLTLAR